MTSLSSPMIPVIHTTGAETYLLLQSLTLSTNKMSESESDASSGSNTAAHLTVPSSANGHKRSKERRDYTRKRVANAVASCINHASDLGPELLSLGVKIADCAHIPSLSGIARRLLEIWRAIEQVRVNRDDALRLAGRCADILSCVKADINRNGERVPTALELPIQRLEDTLDSIHLCMEKHIHQSLVLQYLRKNSISRDISYCGSLLDDALTLINFGLGLNFQQTLIEIVIHRGSVIQSREAINPP